MPELKTAMDIFQILDRSNCRQCGMKTCLAFAGAVSLGQRQLAECPKLDRETVERFVVASAPDVVAQTRAALLQKLRREIAGLDFAAAAERAGGRVVDQRLTVKVLGKDFGVDRQGRLFSDIHVNPWVAMPFFQYVLYGEGLPVSGNWVSFRDLKGGPERYPLFRKRCEDAMKKVADRHTDFFDDIVHLFHGRQVEKQFAADISVILLPLPRVPLMICYWKPGAGLDSNLNIFFDETVIRNLDIGAVFSLGTGLAQMFEKLAQRHGFSDASRPV